MRREGSKFKGALAGVAMGVLGAMGGEAHADLPKTAAQMETEGEVLDLKLLKKQVDELREKVNQAHEKLTRLGVETGKKAAPVPDLTKPEGEILRAEHFDLQAELIDLNGQIEEAESEAKEAREGKKKGGPKPPTKPLDVSGLEDQISKL